MQVLNSYKNQPISVELPQNISSPPVVENPCPEIKESEEAPLKEEESIAPNDLPERKPDDICSPLPYTLPPINVQWRKNLRSIFNASLKVIGPGGSNMESWIALLLDHLSPIELLQSVQNLPNMNDLRPIVEKLHKRYQYHVQNDYKLKFNDGKHEYDENRQRMSGIPPPVTILVFGGSVTVGTLCRFNPLEMKFSALRKRCAWPFRLEYFINTMLGFDAVYIQSDALGGTNTELATQRFQYGLLPESMPNPDIVINSYSTNDMHILSMERAEALGISLYQAVWDLIQEFVRNVKGTQQECKSGPDREDAKSMHSPLIIYLDDYLGNEQDEVLETMAFSSALKRIAQYYRIMSISYADAIRHMVYANTRESWFSPNWYAKDEFVRQVHPSLGGHISIMWVIAFNLWNSLTTFCNEEAALIERKSMLQPVKRTDGSIYSYSGGENMPQIQLSVPLKGWPSPIPQGLIPELTPDLKLSEISKKWSDSTNDEYDSKCSELKTTNIEKPCPFTWISNVDGIENVDTLTQKMNEVLVQNIGWEAVQDHGKIGFSPATDGIKNPLFTIELRSIQKPIKSINFLTMRSYGERWEDSRISIQILRTNKATEEEVEKTELIGFHSSETSVSYRDSITLDEGKTQVGDTIKMMVTLIGGQTFKFNGISICHQ